MVQNETQIIAAWVAWGTHRHQKKALEDAEDSVRQMAELYMSGRQQEPDKHDSITNAPVNWAILHNFFITIARYLRFPTIAQAKRALSNQLEKVFSLLV
jgi:hypothetical protein